MKKERRPRRSGKVALKSETYRDCPRCKMNLLHQVERTETETVYICGACRTRTVVSS